MKRILVGVDGSEISRAATVWAAGLARATGAALQLASFIDPPLVFGADVPSTSVIGNEFEKAVSRAQVMLTEIAAMPELKTLSVQLSLLDGPVAKGIAELAEKDVDLVVVGHRSRSALARTMLGSVADRLAQICPCPVVVYR